MSKHAKPEQGSSKLRVVDCKVQPKATERLLDVYDATVLVGLRTLVHGAAIARVCEANGEETIELPKLNDLLASAVMARCLMPIRLRGWEIKAMRRIMKLTLAELASKLDERTATETVSRWESESQPMGGYAEKLLRLLVCEELSKAAPGVQYAASMIAHLRVQDPWRVDKNYEVPHIHLSLVRLKEQSGEVIDAWDAHAA